MTLFILVLYVGFGNKSVCSTTPVRCHPARDDITETWGLFAELTHKCKCSTWFYGDGNHCSTIVILCFVHLPKPAWSPHISMNFSLVWEGEKKLGKGGTFMKMARFQEDSPLLHVKVVKGVSHRDENVQDGTGWPTSQDYKCAFAGRFHCISVVAFNTSVCSGLCSDLKAGSKLNQINKTKIKRLRQQSLPDLKRGVSLGCQRNLQSLMFRQGRSHLGLHKRRGEPVVYILSRQIEKKLPLTNILQQLYWEYTIKKQVTCENWSEVEPTWLE